jgi:polyisoprenoid-binding protein YceI
MALAIGAVLLSAMLMARGAEAEVRRWAPIAGKSEVGFAASFPLGNFTGITQDVDGQFAADPADLRVGVTGHLLVKASTLRTGNGSRDRDMQEALSVDRFPEIRFTVQQVAASFPSATDRADVLLTISGLMRIHGIERPISFPARLRLRDDKVWVRGEAELKMSDYGVKAPSRFFLSVSDRVVASFDLLFAETR